MNNLNQQTAVTLNTRQKEKTFYEGTFSSKIHRKQRSKWRSCTKTYMYIRYDDKMYFGFLLLYECMTV